MVMIEPDMRPTTKYIFEDSSSPIDIVALNYLFQVVERLNSFRNELCSSPDHSSNKVFVARSYIYIKPSRDAWEWSVSHTHEPPRKLSCGGVHHAPVQHPTQVCPYADRCRRKCQRLLSFSQLHSKLFENLSDANCGHYSSFLITRSTSPILSLIARAVLGRPTTNSYARFFSNCFRSLEAIANLRRRRTARWSHRRSTATITAS